MPKGGWILVAVLVLAGCGSGDDSAQATPEPTVMETTDATPTPTEDSEADAVAFSRETQVAVARCIEAVTDLGYYFAAYGTDLWYPDDVKPALETASAECDEASLQIDVDGTDAVGDTPDNRAQVLIAERNYDIALLSAAIITDDSEALEQASEYYKPANDFSTEGVYAWAAELESAVGEG